MSVAKRAVQSEQIKKVVKENKQIDVQIAQLPKIVFFPQCHYAITYAITIAISSVKWSR